MHTIDLTHVGINFLNMDRERNKSSEESSIDTIALKTDITGSSHQQRPDQQHKDSGPYLVKDNQRNSLEFTSDAMTNNAKKTFTDSDKESKDAENHFKEQPGDAGEDDDIEKAWYAYLCRLLLEGGGQALRQVFNSIHPTISLADRLSKPDALKVLRRLRLQNIITGKQWETLYPKHRRNISSTNYDAPLLVLLLQNICHMSPPYPNGWRGVPLPTDTSISADIARISYFRKLLASRQKFSAADCKKHRAQMHGVIVRLGGKCMKAKLERQAEDKIQPQLQNTWINKVMVSSSSVYILPKKKTSSPVNL